MKQIDSIFTTLFGVDYDQNQKSLFINGMILSPPTNIPSVIYIAIRSPLSSISELSLIEENPADWSYLSTTYLVEGLTTATSMNTNSFNLVSNAFPSTPDDIAPSSSPSYEYPIIWDTSDYKMNITPGHEANITFNWP